MQSVRRGQVVLAKTGPAEESARPCVVVQNDIGNKASPYTIVVPLSHWKPTRYPFQAEVKRSDVHTDGDERGIPSDSFADCAHIYTIHQKNDIIRRLGHLSPESLFNVGEALKVSLELDVT